MLVEEAMRFVVVEEEPMTAAEETRALQEAAIYRLGGLGTSESFFAGAFLMPGEEVEHLRQEEDYRALVGIGVNVASGGRSTEDLRYLRIVQIPAPVAIRLAIALAKANGVHAKEA